MMNIETKSHMETSTSREPAANCDELSEHTAIPIAYDKFSNVYQFLNPDYNRSFRGLKRKMAVHSLCTFTRLDRRRSGDTFSKTVRDYWLYMINRDALSVGPKAKKKAPSPDLTNENGAFCIALKPDNNCREIINNCDLGTFITYTALNYLHSLVIGRNQFDSSLASWIPGITTKAIFLPDELKSLTEKDSQVSLIIYIGHEAKKIFIPLSLVTAMTERPEAALPHVLPEIVNPDGWRLIKPTQKQISLSYTRTQNFAADRILRADPSNFVAADLCIVVDYDDTTNQVSQIGQVQNDPRNYVGLGTPVSLRISLNSDSKLTEVLVKNNHQFTEADSALCEVQSVLEKTLMQITNGASQDGQENFGEIKKPPHSGRETITKRSEEVQLALIASTAKKRNAVNNFFANKHLISDCLNKNSHPNPEIETSLLLIKSFQPDMKTLLQMAILMTVSQDYCHFLVKDKKTELIAPCAMPFPFRLQKEISDIVKSGNITAPVSVLQDLHKLFALYKTDLKHIERSQGGMVTTIGSAAKSGRKTLEGLASVIEGRRKESLLNKTILLSFLVTANGYTSSFEKEMNHKNGTPHFRQCAFTTAFTEIYPETVFAAIDTDDGISVSVRNRGKNKMQFQHFEDELNQNMDILFTFFTGIYSSAIKNI